MSRRSSTFTTAPVVLDESRPKLASADLSASHQWPFHLRLHPDRWEYQGGSWRPEIERVHLRPGVAGVVGKNGDLASIRDTSLTAAWANAEDRKWVLLSNGDKRLTSLLPDGQFLDVLDVSVVENGRLRHGTVHVACWENVDAAGKIIADEAKLSRIALELARVLWGVSEPTEAARAHVINGMARVLNQLEETGARRPNGGSPSMLRRMARLRSNLLALTGDDRYRAPSAAQPAPVYIQAPAPAPNPMADLLAGVDPTELAQLIAEMRARKTQAAAPATVPSAPPPAAPIPPPAATPALPPAPTRAPARGQRGADGLPPMPGFAG